MVIHQLVVNSFNKILPRLKANAVELANLRASWFVLYLLSTSCVLTLPFSSFLVLFGYILLLLSSRRCGGLHVGLCGLLGTSFTSRRPCGALATYMFYASALMYQT